MKYWLMKSEPNAFSIDDLKNCPKQQDHWDGVRNYQARNMMRDDMKKGDLILFYHSNCNPPGIVGTATVVKEAIVDHTALDPKDPHFDPKSNPNNPHWMMVTIRYQQKFKQPITLPQLKNSPALKDMLILRKGNRLSITPVTKQEWEFIINLATR